MERSGIRMSRGGRSLAVVAGVALVSLTAAGRAQAQSMDTRWLPWLGCWHAQGADPLEDLLVCVGPVGSGVEIATLTDGEIASSRMLVADGQRHELTADACTGWQSAEFSADGQRVFMRSEVTCESGERRTASAIMAMTESSTWLDAQSVGLGDDMMARVVRYRPASNEVARSAGFAIPAERMAEVADARFIAAADLSLADVSEAASRVDGQALAALLIESEQTFDLSADRIVAMVDAGVPEDVIDVMVALSYPQRFAIDREARPEPVREERQADVRDRYYDPFGWGWYGYGCRPGYWSMYCDPYRYSYGYGYGFGYGGLYNPYWGYGFGTRPVIVVVGEEDDGGRMVRGRGYTRSGSSSTSGRTARPSSSGSSRPASTVTGGTSRAGSGSAGGSSGSSSSGRTAKRRGGG